MNKPALLPQFATDATWTSGPESGQPVRATVPPSVLKQGFIAGLGYAAAAANTVVGNLSDWCAYLSKIQIKNWKTETTGFFGSSYTNYGALWLPETAGIGSQAGSWFLFGAQSGVAFACAKQPTTDGSFGSGGLATPTLDNWACSATNADGSILLAAGIVFTGTNTLIQRSTNRAASWASQTVTTSFNHAIVAMTFEPVSGLFVLATGFPLSGGILYTSPDGITWTLRSSPTGAGTDTVVNMVAANGTVALFTNTGKVAKSLDGGVTWGAFQNPGITAFDAAWTSSYGWCLLGTAGIVFSADLLVFGTPLTPFGANKATSIASDGVSRYAFAHYDTTATPGPGVAFIDDGQTVEFVRFSASASTKYLPRLIRYNGHSQWGLLGAPSGATSDYSWSTSLKL